MAIHAQPYQQHLLTAILDTTLTQTPNYVLCKLTNIEE